MNLFAETALLVLAYMTAWFGIALALRRNDVADVAWGLGFVAIAWWAWVIAAPGALRSGLIAVLVTVWGVRLALHIGRRNFSAGHREDERYATWRREWGRWFVLRSYLQVFVLQGAFMLLVATPVVIAAGSNAPLGWLDAVGILVWLAGVALEATADAQLAAHLAVPENRGHPLERGVWAASRHPNYLGDALAWWGIGVIALSSQGGWWGLTGPLAMTLLLRYVSGVPMLEKRHVGEPEWDVYRSRVGVFLPRLPRR